MKITLAPPTYPMLKKVARNMLPADIEELKAMSGNTPMQALRHGVRASYECYVALADGEPFAVFGISANDNGVGVPWMLTTGKQRQFPRVFLGYCKRFVKRWSAMHRELNNWVDERHTVAVRWLEWLGFSLGCPMNVGRDGEPFINFWMARTNV